MWILAAASLLLGVLAIPLSVAALRRRTLLGAAVAVGVASMAGWAISLEHGRRAWSDGMGDCGTLEHPGLVESEVALVVTSLIVVAAMLRLRPVPPALALLPSAVIWTTLGVVAALSPEC